MSAKLIGVVMASCLWFGVPAIAEERVEDRLRQCASVAEEPSRLACYDMVAEKLAKPSEPRQEAGTAAPAPPSLPATGRWIVREEKNPIDDSPTVTLLLDPPGASDPTIIARCKDRKTELFIAFNDYLGSASDPQVAWRVGEAPPVRGTWNTSTSGKAAFAPSPIAVLREMTKNPRFVIEVTTRLVGQRLAVFDTRGLGEALKPLQRACRWS